MMKLSHPPVSPGYLLPGASCCEPHGRLCNVFSAISIQESPKGSYASQQSWKAKLLEGNDYWLGYTCLTLSLVGPHPVGMKTANICCFICELQCQRAALMPTLSRWKGHSSIDVFGLHISFTMEKGNVISLPRPISWKVLAPEMHEKYPHRLSPLVVFSCVGFSSFHTTTYYRVKVGDTAGSRKENRTLLIDWSQMISAWLKCCRPQQEPGLSACLAGSRIYAGPPS